MTVDTILLQLFLVYTYSLHIFDRDLKAERVCCEVDHIELNGLGSGSSSSSRHKQRAV